VQHSDHAEPYGTRWNTAYESGRNAGDESGWNAFYGSEWAGAQVSISDDPAEELPGEHQCCTAATRTRRETPNLA
jgi:hypothetical protein